MRSVGAKYTPNDTHREVITAALEAGKAVYTDKPIAQTLEDALAAVEKGPLPQAALDRLSALREGFSGEPR